MTTTITITEAKKNFPNVVNQVSKGKTFIVRNTKVAIINLPLLIDLVKHLEKHDPGLADSIAISLDRETQMAIEESLQEFKRGDVLPFDE